MITKHIKRLQYINGTWVIELWNSQIIYGNGNLAASLDIVRENVWPQPELSVIVDLTKPLLKAG
jgi:hypothetical protein